MRSEEKTEVSRLTITIQCIKQKNKKPKYGFTCQRTFDDPMFTLGTYHSAIKFKSQQDAVSAVLLYILKQPYNTI